MEKYGVDVDPSAHKTAAEAEVRACPACKSELLKSTNIPKCPRCGTLPFEPEK